MGMTAAVDAAMDDVDWPVFLAAGLITGFFSLSMVLSMRPSGRISLSPKQAFLITTFAWVGASSVGALPFMFSTLHLSFTDSFFETMSGLSTTGATIIVGIDEIGAGLKLWRGILHWLGGIGIIVMAVAILPILRIGGMQLFRMESSDKMETAMPRITELATGILSVYTLFTVIGSVLLHFAGMDWLEAVVHTMASLGTGGFSTSDDSIAHFQSPLIEWIIIMLMIIGGMTFVLFVAAWKKGAAPLLRDSQTGWYFACMVFFALLIGAWQYSVNNMGWHDAYRHALFTVVSIVTTTGFASADWNLWGNFPLAACFILTFVGGCTGSTAGGIKIFRFQVLFAMARIHVKRLIYPRGVFTIDFNRQSISDSVVRSVLGFIVLYIFSFAAIGITLSLLGLDFVTSFSGAAATLGNVGPGLGEIIGPLGSYRPLSDAAKWVLSFAMLLGRLELMAVLVLLMPSFWRK
jgi:trk system potassium uptake protein TrkH